MKTRLPILTLALLCAAGASHSQSTANLPRGTVLEASVESATDQIVFPATLPGSLQARPCPACAYKVLPLDANTRFNLGGQLVTLQQMTAFCVTSTSKPLTVHYRLSDGVVSLVSVPEK